MSQASLGGRRWSTYVAAFLAVNRRCHLCRQPIDLALPRAHRMAGTVDHVVPVSQGGARWDPANHRAAHRDCNLRRGTKVVGSLGSMSKVW